MVMVSKVRNITGLTGNGVKDWYFQRLSAIILAVYALFIVGFMVGHQPLDYATWSQLYSHTLMKIFTLFAAISLLLHTWVGMWTIFTDYVKCSFLRVLLQVLVMLVLLACLVWSIQILWG
jgi:succinate dehydrogenase / fumarate reductase membrane anchor subunit